MSRVLERDRAALVVIDMQEAFRPAVGEFDTVVHNAGVLVQGAREAGFDRHLVKPVDPAEIESILESYQRPERVA